MKKSHLLPLFLAAAALTGCESAADIERKPEVANGMVEQSLARCNLQGDSAQKYGQRLREVLVNTRTTNLEKLQSEGVTVCLDRRLSSQKTRFLSAFAEGTYYRTDHTLTIIDSGKNNDSSSVFTRDAIDHGGLIIARLADKISHGKTSSMMIAKRVGCGKNCTTTKLYNADGHKAYDLNPQLRTAPLRNPSNW